MKSPRNKETNLTQREEIFCNKLVDNGNNATRAYEDAFGRGKKSYNTLVTAGCKLRKDERIQARVKFLLDERARESSVSREDATSLLVSIVKFDIGRLFKKGKDGVSVVKSLDEMTREERMYVQSFDKNGMPVILDKMQALNRILEINGLKTREEVKISVGGKLGQLLGGGAISKGGWKDDNPDTMNL